MTGSEVAQTVHTPRGGTCVAERDALRADGETRPDQNGPKAVAAPPAIAAPASVAKSIAKVELRRQRTALRRDNKAADAAAASAERAAIARAATERATARRTQRAERRSVRAAHIAGLARRLRPVVPLLFVSGWAAAGQVSYGLTHYSPADWPFLARLLAAIAGAITVESIALYVQWHAHDALLMKATATAARLRRASYAIAFGVAGINYSHFSDHWSPTPAAAVFAFCSAIGPWLWGLHTRRLHDLQLIREGHADSTGATFSVERKRAFPLQAWAARRWSIDHNVNDPRIAWDGYKQEAAERAALKAAAREAHRRALDSTSGPRRASRVRSWFETRANARPAVSSAADPSMPDSLQTKAGGEQKVRVESGRIGLADRSGAGPTPTGSAFSELPRAASGPPNEPRTGPDPTGMAVKPVLPTRLDAPRSEQSRPIRPLAPTVEPPLPRALKLQGQGGRGSDDESFTARTDDGHGGPSADGQALIATSNAGAWPWSEVTQRQNLDLVMLQVALDADARSLKARRKPAGRDKIMSALKAAGHPIGSTTAQTYQLAINEGRRLESVAASRVDPLPEQINVDAS